MCPPFCYNINIMEDIVENIANNLNLNLFSYFIKPRANKVGILVYELIEALLLYKSSAPAIESLGYSSQTFNRNIQKLFPNVKLNGGGETWGYYLLSKSDYKHCGSCKAIKAKTEFTISKDTSDGLNRKCKYCNKVSNAYWYENNKDYHRQYLINNRASFNLNSAKRRAIEKSAIPSWANIEKIKEIYINCPEGYHVDHIVPLQGKYICGLHVESNLQHLTVEENLSKGNRFDYWWDK